MFCQACWANLPDGTGVCPRCGNDPATPPAKAQRPVKRFRPPEKKSPFPAFLTTLVILTFIAGSVYYIHTRRSPETKETKAPELAVTAVELKPEPPVFTESLSSLKLEAEVPGVYDEGGQGGQGGDEAGKLHDEAVSAFNGGDYVKASELLKEALEDSPDNEILTRDLAHSLAALGWEEYKGEDFAGAREHFLEAIALDENQTFYKGLAYALLKGDDLEGAVEALEKVKADPDAKGLLKSIYTRLGQELYRSGELEEAIGYFEKGLALDPDDGNIKQVLRRLRSENGVEEGFRVKEGSHFTVKFEGGVNSVAGNVIGILLEEAYFKVGAELGYYPEDTIGAVLYSRDEFRDITRSPSWAGAIYDGRIKIPAGGITDRTDVLEKVIFHEYTHAVVHRLSGGRAPVWLNEGIAQYEEGKRAASYERLIKDTVRTKRVSLRVLEGSFMGLAGNDALRAYALSLSATEYIMNEFGTLAVKTILEGLRDGLSLDEAVSSAVYLSYDMFEESWLTSLRR